MLELDQVSEKLTLAARGLVNDPGQVSIEMIESPASVTFRMTVAPSDVAKLVGKSGRTARALRTLLSGLRRPGQKVILLDIVEDRVAMTS